MKGCMIRCHYIFQPISIAFIFYCLFLTFHLEIADAQANNSLNSANGVPNAVYVDSNGDVGIGTTTPNARLSISGGVAFPRRRPPTSIFLDDNVSGDPATALLKLTATSFPLVSVSGAPPTPNKTGTASIQVYADQNSSTFTLSAGSQQMPMVFKTGGWRA